jgi:hypothetical protein
MPESENLYGLTKSEFESLEVVEFRGYNVVILPAKPISKPVYYHRGIPYQIEGDFQEVF